MIKLEPLHTLEDAGPIHGCRCRAKYGRKTPQLMEGFSLSTRALMRLSPLLTEIKWRFMLCLKSTATEAR